MEKCVQIKIFAKTPPMEEQLEPLSLSDTRKILAELNAIPSKKLGQNFLVDKNIVWKSLEFSNILSTDIVIEIGPGLGTLTRALLPRECTVYAIEFDKKLYHYLAERFKNFAQFNILCGDAVDFPFAGYSPSNGNFKIVANLPYNISTPWMEAVLMQPYLPQSMTLMLQKEAALRLIAPCGTKHYSALSVLLANAYEKKELFSVSRKSFMPMPGVDSVLLHLERKSEVYRLHPQTYAILRQIFTQRRKQVYSLVRKFYPEGLESFKFLLNQQNYPLSVRPEQLSENFWTEWDRTLFG